MLIPAGNYRLSPLLPPEVPGAWLHILPAVTRDSRPLIFLSEAEMRRSLSSGWSEPELRLVEMRNVPPPASALLSESLLQASNQGHRALAVLLSPSSAQICLRIPKPTGEVAQLFPLEAIIKVKNYFYYNPALLTQSFLKNSPFALIFSMP